MNPTYKLENYYDLSFLRPMTLVNRVIRPPKKRVVKSTTTRVLLTSRSEFLDKNGLIYRDRAKAMAPLMLPLNHRRESYLKFRAN